MSVVVVCFVGYIHSAALSWFVFGLQCKAQSLFEGSSDLFAHTFLNVFNVTGQPHDEGYHVRGDVCCDTVEASFMCMWSDHKRMTAWQAGCQGQAQRNDIEYWCTCVCHIVVTVFMEGLLDLRGPYSYWVSVFYSLVDRLSWSPQALRLLRLLWSPPHIPQW